MGTTSVRCVVTDIQPIDTRPTTAQHSPFTRTVVPRNRSGPHAHVQDTAAETYTTAITYSLRTPLADSTMTHIRHCSQTLPPISLTYTNAPADTHALTMCGTPSG